MHEKQKNVLILLLGALCIGWAPILVKSIPNSPSVIAFYRTFLGALLLTPFCWQDFRRIYPQSTRSFWLLLGAGGFAFAMDLAVWHRSIQYAGAGIATVLGNMQVFTAGFVGYFALKEKLSWAWLFGSAMALLGVALMAKAFSSASSDPLFYRGVFFGLATAPFYTAYLFTLRRSQYFAFKPGPMLCLCLILYVCAFFSAILAILEGNTFTLAREHYFYVFALALFAQVLGWLCITVSLPGLPLSLSGLLLLFQPLTSLFLGYLLFGELLSQRQQLGVGLTLIGIYVASLTRTKREYR